MSIKLVRQGDKRFKQYPKDSVLLLQLICNNCQNLENIIKMEFKKKYKHRNDIGIQYFEDDFSEMIKDIIKLKNRNDNLTLRDIEIQKDKEIEDRLKKKKEK